MSSFGIKNNETEIAKGMSRNLVIAVLYLPDMMRSTLSKFVVNYL